MQKVKDIYCTENNFVNFLVEPRYRLYRHLLIWIYLIITFYDGSGVEEFEGVYNIYVRLVWIAYFLFMVYINMYVLVRYLLFRGRYITYLVMLIGTIVVSYLVIKQVMVVYFEPHRIMPKSVKMTLLKEIFSATNLLTLIVFSSTAIKLFQQWKQDSTRIAELEKTTLQMELKELKNQISPHFLFNMLNNVNVLVTKDPAKASLIIMKLSDFLRYQLYENNAASVQLSSEVQFLNDFMELEKIRRDDFTFTLTINGRPLADERLENISLPPSMFIVFVENAIKYSIDPDYPSYVHADFTIANGRLHFMCRNSKAKEPLENKGSGGLGLINIKRRLELLYEDTYMCTVRDTETEYEVNLILPL